MFLVQEKYSDQEMIKKVLFLARHFVLINLDENIKKDYHSNTNVTSFHLGYM